MCIPNAHTFADVVIIIYIDFHYAITTQSLKSQHLSEWMEPECMCVLLLSIFAYHDENDQLYLQATNGNEL